MSREFSTLSAGLMLTEACIAAREASRRWRPAGDIRRTSITQRISFTLALLAGLVTFSKPVGCAWADGPSEPPASILSRAEAAYTQGIDLADADPAKSRQAFGRAIDAYEALVSQGVRNGHLAYNLGNAYLHQGRVGPAILNYLRAKQWIPTDADLAHNLAIARSRCLTPITESRSGALWDRLEAIATWLPARMRLTAAMVLNFIGWSALAGYFLRPRKAFLRFACGFIFAGMLFGATVAVERYMETRYPACVILGNDVYLRGGPGQGYPKRFEQPLQPGVEFSRLETRGAWWQARLPDGQSGWLPAETAALVIPP